MINRDRRAPRQRFPKTRGAPRVRRQRPLDCDRASSTTATARPVPTGPDRRTGRPARDISAAPRRRSAPRRRRRLDLDHGRPAFDRAQRRKVDAGDAYPHEAVLDRCSRPVERKSFWRARRTIGPAEHAPFTIRAPHRYCSSTSSPCSIQPMRAPIVVRLAHGGCASAGPSPSSIRLAADVLQRCWRRARTAPASPRWRLLDADWRTRPAGGRPHTSAIERCTGGTSEPWYSRTWMPRPCAGPGAGVPLRMSAGAGSLSARTSIGLDLRARDHRLPALLLGGDEGGELRRRAAHGDGGVAARALDRAPAA